MNEDKDFVWDGGFDVNDDDDLPPIMLFKNKNYFHTYLVDKAGDWN